MNKISQGAVFAGLVAFATTSQAGLINNTSKDGNHTALTCLFNGVASASQCERPASGTKLSNVPTSGWLTEVSDMGVNAEARLESTWRISALAEATSQIVIEIAGNKNLNSFGIYNPSDTTQRLELFAGSDSDTSTQTITYGNGKFTVGGEKASWGSATFGFYLHNPNLAQAFFSNPDANPNDDVQMVAFQGDGERQADFLNSGTASTWHLGAWILAWEDLVYKTSDQDFNDFVIKVSGIKPVPEPMTLALLGLGLIGMAFITRRTRRKDEFSA